MPNHVDPVCGMAVREGEDALITEYAGQTYHFCSEACRATFEKEPERFAIQANVNGRNQSKKKEDVGGM
jgi:YHS domain-containing protein